MQKLKVMLEILDVPVDRATRADVERLVLALEEKHLRPVTLIDYPSSSSGSSSS